MYNNNNNITSPPTTTKQAAIATVQLPTDKTRRKRLKVVSACSECRRKKTKCNGEKPCAGCIKTNMDCKYSNSPKSRPNAQSNNTRPIKLTANTSSTLVSPTTTSPTHSTLYQQHQQYQQQQQRAVNNNNTTANNNNNTSSKSNSNSNNSSSLNTIHAIENRLSVIEDILKVLILSSSNNNNVSAATEVTPVRNSAFLPHSQSQQQYRNMHAHHSVGPNYGEIYNNNNNTTNTYSSSPYHPQPKSYHNNGSSGYYWPPYTNNKRRYLDEEEQSSEHQQQPITYDHVRLPPPLNYQPTLSESSSTSTASSISSSTSSPKINTISTLLNNDNEKEYNKPSAFYRPIATNSSSPPLLVIEAD